MVAALAFPQSLGYASIAGAPVEVGLYAVPVALVAYAIFGGGRSVLVGDLSFFPVTPYMSRTTIVASPTPGGGMYRVTVYAGVPSSETAYSRFGMIT